MLYEPHPVDEYDPDEEVPFLLVPLGESRPGDPAFGLVERADAVYWGADLLGPRALVEGYAGDSSVLEVRDLDGKVLFEVDVLDGHDPEMPPSIGAAAWSSDGTRITWIEYPYDPPGAADEPTRVKSVAVATGELVFSIPLGADVYPTFNPVHSIHDLGTHVVINTLGFAANTWWPEPATILSFTADEPELWQLPVTGVAVPVPYVVG